MKLELVQCIKIEGKNVNDIFRLPCVLGVRKDGYRGFVVILFGDTRNKYVRWGEDNIARIGDWLCEGDRGVWHVLSDSDYKRLSE